LEARFTRVCFVVAAISLSTPLFAQIDFSGEWVPRFYEDQPERGPGPELGDYLGLPINAAVRLRADTRSASLITLPEWQCRPHPATISGRGPSNLTITKEIDPVSPRDHRLSHGMSAIQGPPRLPR
jgi:hypothetical protein